MNNNVIDIKELQSKILEIVCFLDEFCKRHNIVYYLMGGSALGAVRHKGFIPWDDDLDVFMTFDNYQKFLEIARNELNTDRYYLQEEATPEWPIYFTKLRMNNTTYIEQNVATKMHQGIFIDIMCLNRASEYGFCRILQYGFAKCLIAKSLYMKGYCPKSFKKRLLMSIAYYSIHNRLETKMLKYIRYWNNKNTRLVGHFFGKAKYRQTSFPEFFLGKQRYVKFENVYLPVPQLVEEYLTMRYGNYMKLPSKSEQKTAIHAIYVDLNTDYTKYV